MSQGLMLPDKEILLESDQTILMGVGDYLLNVREFNSTLTVVST